MRIYQGGALLVAILSIVFASGPFSRIADADDVRTATAAMEVPATGSNCRDGETRACSPQDCVQCRDLIIHLPLGAEVLTIRYYSTAGGNDGDVALREIQPGMGAWSEMKVAAQTSTPQNVIVKAQFRNWKHDRARLARIEVDWR